MGITIPVDPLCQESELGYEILLVSEGANEQPRAGSLKEVGLITFALLELSELERQ